MICFSVRVQIQKYFLGLKSNMPSMSPIDKKWPARPYGFLDGVHTELRKIFHHWRVGHKHNRPHSAIFKNRALSWHFFTYYNNCIYIRI